jgi:hypothetical protein
VNNKTPDETPIIPVTLITWPIVIFLSVITDLPLSFRERTGILARFGAKHPYP